MLNIIYFSSHCGFDSMGMFLCGVWQRFIIKLTKDFKKEPLLLDSGENNIN